MELFATMKDCYMGDDILPLGDEALDDHLDLPWSMVCVINMNYRSLSQRKDAYLDLYATTHPCPSWRQVAEALRYVYLLHQARVVENTYVQGTMIILIHSFCDHYYHRMC